MYQTRNRFFFSLMMSAIAICFVLSRPASADSHSSLVTVSVTVVNSCNINTNDGVTLTCSQAARPMVTLATSQQTANTPNVIGAVNTTTSNTMNIINF